MQKIEVIFTPALYPYRTMNGGHITVVNDILRATTSICTALRNGVKALIPVSTIEEARKYKQRGFLVAGERIEQTFEFADWGNSALEFTKERVEGKEIVHSTTNGTIAIALAKQSKPYQILIGAFCNLSTLSDYLLHMERDVQILCSGWKNTFSLEDAVYSGALTDRLIHTGKFEARNDSAQCALELWNAAKNDLRQYMEKASHIHRLRKYGMDDVFDYTFELDTCNVVPLYRDEKIIDAIQ